MAKSTKNYTEHKDDFSSSDAQFQILHVGDDYIVVFVECYCPDCGGVEDELAERIKRAMGGVNVVFIYEQCCGRIYGRKVAEDRHIWILAGLEEEARLLFPRVGEGHAPTTFEELVGKIVSNEVLWRNVKGCGLEARYEEHKKQKEEEQRPSYAGMWI